ncbi:hypothetical protein HK100_002798 [Physocladia obscura]|uniref:Uncharacterized protein n=1 Tax=Physocladia obscura TaxID=109957 RepID=A0AAD5SUU9_9FUNG|nr:hypothetical protein HK100_002798 [Physocladia obscura]
MPVKWKTQREQFPDHKWDYIDVDDFIDESWTMKVKYSMIFFLTVKSVLVYTADVTLLVLMIQSNVFSSNFACIQSNSTSAASASNGIVSVFCQSGELAPQKARPWIMLASIIMSFLLLLLDWRKGRIVIKSGDISYSLTNSVAHRYYVLKSYPHYCFFAEVLNSRKTVDILAFFVFFAFKSWKRLFLAEFPRVYINVLNMYDVLTSLIPSRYKYSNPVVQYSVAFQQLYESRASNGLALASTVLSTFTISMWFFSFCVIVLAFFVYIPLLYVIRGNLKEYVCHKIDKRISEILKKKSRKRTEEARKAELAELERMQQLKVRAENGEIDASEISFKPAPPLGLTQRPTLPDMNVDLDDDESMYGSSIGGSDYGGSQGGRYSAIPPLSVNYAYQMNDMQPLRQYSGQILPSPGIVPLGMLPPPPGMPPPPPGIPPPGLLMGMSPLKISPQYQSNGKSSSSPSYTSFTDKFSSLARSNLSDASLESAGSSRRNLLNQHQQQQQQNILYRYDQAMCYPNSTPGNGEAIQMRNFGVSSNGAPLIGQWTTSPPPPLQQQQQQQGTSLNGFAVSHQQWQLPLLYHRIAQIDEGEGQDPTRSTGHENGRSEVTGTSTHVKLK